MPLIRFSASKRHAKLIFTIILLGKIMPFYFYYIEKRLLYPFVWQLFHGLFVYARLISQSRGSIPYRAWC